MGGGNSAPSDNLKILNLIITRAPRAEPHFILQDPDPVLSFVRMDLSVEMFKPEIAEALKAYEKFIVCLDKTPDELLASLQSLLEKAIKAYQSRGVNLRHGIALDRQVTIILSQTDHDRPLCGIYFNLSSPYHKKTPARKAKVEEGT